MIILTGIAKNHIDADRLVTSDDVDFSEKVFYSGMLNLNIEYKNIPAWKAFFRFCEYANFEITTA